MPQRDNGSGKARKLEIRPHRLTDKEFDAALRRIRTVKNPLNRLRAMHDALGHEVALIDEWVNEAKEDGATWEQIGDALGITRQSAWERFGKK